MVALDVIHVDVKRILERPGLEAIPVIVKVPTKTAVLPAMYLNDLARFLSERGISHSTSVTGDSLQTSLPPDVLRELAAEQNRTDEPYVAAILPIDHPIYNID